MLPEFSPPYVEVQTEALGLSAEEVEQLITAPMENLLLNGVAFLDGIRSESVNGLSSITLIFEPGTDLLEARQVVQERLMQAGLLAHLPEPPAIVQPLSSASRVVVVGFTSEEVSPIDCRCSPDGPSVPGCSGCRASPTCRSSGSVSGSSRFRWIPSGLRGKE